MEAGAVVKGEGKPNDLMERISKDDIFKTVHPKLDQLLNPRLFVGRSPEQVDEFISEEIDPVISKYAELISVQSVDGVNV